MLRKLLILLLVFLLTSCSNNNMVVKYSPGEAWKIENVDYNLSYNIEFSDITNSDFKLKLINNLSESNNYNIVLSYINNVDYIVIGTETIFITTEGVIPISYFDIPEFTGEINIYFHFITENKCTKISTSFDTMFVNSTDVPIYGISIELYAD